MRSRGGPHPASRLYPGGSAKTMEEARRHWQIALTATNSTDRYQETLARQEAEPSAPGEYGAGVVV